MKILCDVHLPKKLVAFFLQHDIEAIHGSEILSGFLTKDGDFCRYADEHDFVIITKDTDFRNTHFLQHTPRKLIKVNLGNISNRDLLTIFQSQLPSLVKVFEHSNAYVEINKDSVSVLIH